MKRTSRAAGVAGLLAVALLVAMRLGTILGAVSVQCGGSFLPQLNCTIPGLWNFTNTTDAGPFQVRGITATGVTSAVVDLTNAQVLALNSTPVTIIAAPGAGYFIDVIGVSAIFNYTAVYSGGSDLKCFWGSRVAGNACSPAITTSGFLTNAADIIRRVGGVPDNTNPPTTNLPVVIEAIANTAFAGGDAANSVRIVIHYRRVTTAL